MWLYGFLFPSLSCAAAQDFIPDIVITSALTHYNEKPLKSPSVSFSRPDLKLLTAAESTSSCVKTVPAIYHSEGKSVADNHDYKSVWLTSSCVLV